MASITKQIIPGYSLTGTTNGNSTSPISYTVTTPAGSFSGLVGAQIANFRLVAVDNNNTKVILENGLEFVLPNSALQSFNVNITQAFNQIRQEIPQAAQTTTGSTGTATTSTTPVTGPATTTNPSNSLPLGDQIEDIYDPNLTPEQVASLNPGDQKARADALGYEYKGPAVTPGEIDPNTGEIIVTAPGDGNPIPPSPLSQYDDWRVRLSLAPSSNYLYNAEDPKILAPLKETNGVIFPYTPTISVNYAANYEQSTIIHSNYKVYQYSNSSVDNVTITCDFTAQDTREANYLLAVIHFFRSVTKMFFGQDDYPRAGTPPPLCYLTGMGNYQFSEHPLAITGFSYNLPNDVDYIKTVGPSISGLPLPAAPIPTGRLPDNILPGGRPAPPDFAQLAVSPAQENTVSWVPTKIQLSVTGVPIISRNQMSQVFSLKEYANGSLLNVRNSPDGGFW